LVFDCSAQPSVANDRRPGHPQNRPRSARQYGWTYFVGFRCTHIHQRGARKRTKLSSNVSRVLHLRGTVRRRSGAMHSPDVAVVRGVIDPSARQRLSARPLLIRGRSAAMCIPGWRSQNKVVSRAIRQAPPWPSRPSRKTARDAILHSFCGTLVARIVQGTELSGTFASSVS